MCANRAPVKIQPAIFFLARDAPRVRGRSARRVRSLACGGVKGSPLCTQIPPPSKCALQFFSQRTRALSLDAGGAPLVRGAPTLPRALPGMRRRRGERALHQSPAPSKKPPAIFFFAYSRALFPYAGDPPSVCGRFIAARAPWHAAASGGARSAPTFRAPQNAPSIFFFGVLTRYPRTRVVLPASAEL